MKTVYQSAVVSFQELKEGKIAHEGSVRIVYHTKDMYKRTAKILGLMDDFKVGFFVYCIIRYWNIYYEKCFLPPLIIPLFIIKTEWIV